MRSISQWGRPTRRILNEHSWGWLEASMITPKRICYDSSPFLPFFIKKKKWVFDITFIVISLISNPENYLISRKNKMEPMEILFNAKPLTSMFWLGTHQLILQLKKRFMNQKMLYVRVPCKILKLRCRGSDDVFHLSIG